MTGAAGVARAVTGSSVAGCRVSCAVTADGPGALNPRTGVVTPCTTPLGASALTACPSGAVNAVGCRVGRAASKAVGSVTRAGGVNVR